MNTNLDTITQNNPISFIRRGEYTYNSGNLNHVISRGIYWIPQVGSDTIARYLLFSATALLPQQGYVKGLGYPLRCLVRLVFSQLPTYSGTKNYQNLLVEVYGGTTGSDWPSTKLDAIIQNDPINLIRSGLYGSGSISYRNTDGDYWQSKVTNTSYVMRLFFYSTGLGPQDESGAKGRGFPLRCLVR